MARAANQKLKILYILKLLEHSDETHVVTMREILAELAAHGIQAERKRIYDDLDALRRFGYPIAARRGRMAGYYLEPEEHAVASKDGEDMRSCEKAQEESSGCLAEDFEARNEMDHSKNRPEWLFFGNTKIELSCADETAKDIWAELGGKGFVKRKAGKRPGDTLLKWKVKPGAEFYGWLAGFGCQVRLEGPPAVIKGYRRFLKEIRNLYREE